MMHGPPPWILLALLGAAPTAAEPASAYRTVQALDVAGGRVEIREDARLTPALAEKMWGVSTDPGFVTGRDDPDVHAFKAAPLLPARLRRIDRAGRIVQDRVLEANVPLARIDTRRLGATRAPFLLITIDNSAGFGSYSGLVTEVYTVPEGRLQRSRATGANGRREDLSFADTLKSAWRIVDARPSHIVIQALRCRPDLSHSNVGEGGEQPFQLIFDTYLFDGRTWRFAERTMPGFWEADEDWPAASRFPRLPGIAPKTRSAPS